MVSGEEDLRGSEAKDVAEGFPRTLALDEDEARAGATHLLLLRLV